jgi:hypothetical protein
MTAEKTKKKTEEKPAANLIFVGKENRWNAEKGKYESQPREAPEFVIDGGGGGRGGERINLPEGIEKGAYVEPDAAARLLALFPNDFKEFKPKGESK